MQDIINLQNNYFIIDYNLEIFYMQVITEPFINTHKILIFI